MIVPDLTGVAKALKHSLNITAAAQSATEDAATTSSLLTETRTWLGRSRTRGLSRASALLEAAFSVEKKQATEQQPPDQTEDVEKRQIAQTSVRVGLATTRTTTIRSTSTVQRTTVVENGTTRTAASSTSVVTRTVTQSASPTSGSSSAFITASASLTGSATSNAATPVSTVTAALAFPAPTCSAASSVQFTDSTGIQYLVKCSTTNAGSAYQQIKVNVGGYGQCFSSCSTTGDCVGFSFVGNDAGTCYLRNVQSTDNDETALVNSDVTCYKIDPSAVASEAPSSDSGSKGSGGSNIGAIAGGVVGGIAGLILLLAIIALFVRRQRKNVDERREKKRINVSRPVLLPQDQYYNGFHPSTNVASVSSGEHHRSGSTANDIYMSEGGFVHRPSSAKKSADLFGDRIGDPPHGFDAGPYTVESGARAKGGDGLVKAGFYGRPQFLHGTPVDTKPGLKQSGSRSSVFAEHMVEMEDTSSRRSPIVQESPILGHNSSHSALATDLRQTQHIMAWNRPDARSDAPVSASLTPRAPPSARLKAFGSSPDLPRDSSSDISLLRGGTFQAPEILGSGVYKP